MLTYLHGEELARERRLAQSMFRDRAIQFRDRLGWEVEVDATGEERDAYDAKNPLYVLWRLRDGRHGGSMRILPTTGDCLVNDHFAHVAGGPIRSPVIWESTRFCISPHAGAQAGTISAALMLAACEIGLAFGLRHGVGVFDARMVRIYRRLGWPPDILGQTGSGRARVAVGLWEFSEAVRQRLCLRAGLSPALSRLWFERAFGRPPSAALAQAG